jgi:GNAT superfamily N-acetyltransferase
MLDHPNATITVDTDQNRLDLKTIHEFLTTSYWARGVPIETVERSIRGSLCFGLYDGDQQVGFARVISDGATFAYLAGVFVLASHRGRGLGKTLMAAILAHPSLQGLRRWLLATRDTRFTRSSVLFRWSRPIDSWNATHRTSTRHQILSTPQTLRPDSNRASVRPVRQTQ